MNMEKKELTTKEKNNETKKAVNGLNICNAFGNGRLQDLGQDGYTLESQKNKSKLPKNVDFMFSTHGCGM